ncbi:MAG: MFS transporter [Myxococcales bacterium]|nr:MFS transporter [Myxococcales bacterium]
MKPSIEPSLGGRLRRLSRDARLYLLGSALMGVGHGALWVHMNLWYRALGLREEAIGTLLALTSFGAMATAIPAAMWVDRVPAGRAFAWSATGFALSLGAQVAWPQPALLWTASLLCGATFTVHWVAAAPFFMRTAAPADRPDLFGYAHAVETLSMLLAAAGVGWLARLGTETLGSERAGMQMGIAAAAATALLAVPVLGAISSQADPVVGATPQTGWRDHLKARDWGLVGRLLAPAAFIGLGAGLIVPFLNLYFRDRYHQTPEAIGTHFAVAQVLMTLGFLVGPAMARRVGTVAAVVTTELASIPFFLLLAFAPTLGWALVGFWCRAALMNMNQPISSAFALQLVPADQQAVTNSLRHLAWNGAWFVSTQIGGGWIERSGYTPPILAAVGFYLAGSLSFWWFFGRAGRRQGLQAAPAA